MPSDASGSSWARAAERRIAVWTLGLGAACSIAAFARVSGRAALGVALGSLLACLNFLWLRVGVERLETLSIQQAGQEKPRLPRGMGGVVIARYALLAAVLCASFFYSLVPPAAVVAGLFTLVAAVVGEGMYSLAHGWEGKPERGSGA